MKNIWSIITIILMTALCFSNRMLADNSKTISHVENVNVETGEGYVPMLPYRLWVTYNDGTSEWRQVRWTNSSLKAEEELADKQKHPAGTIYEVKGFITGDPTTGDGYPVMASVKVTDTPAPTPSPKPVAEPLPLNKVSINGDNRLTWNRDLDTIINTMRPGNLPELEDLEELNAMLVRARNARDASSAARQEAIDYAEMVVSYVSDGSGTRDMIDRAVKQLKATLEVRR